jgi:hypothetical protein
MKPPPCPTLLRKLVLITAATGVSSCATESPSLTPRSQSFSQRELWTVNPRRYLETLSPYERERVLIGKGARRW